MKAAYITKPGPPETIIVGDLPTPQPTGSEVLVRVAAVAVNPIDTYIRSGMVQMPLPSPGTQRVLLPRTLQAGFVEVVVIGLHDGLCGVAGLILEVVGAVESDVHIEA